ncbi:hypothetical protein ACFYWU_05560 [Streptomyces chrestomyceticus]|uniref:hypothetical protein n=1 Tax=Streptomyces chrestomyceticus TaxID=68185 RepID=UPI0036975B8F
MIRIVGAAYLAGLRADRATALDRVQELLEALDVQWADHVQCVLEMAEQREGAERAAHAATEQADELRRAAVAALLVIARQQHRIGELEQAPHSTVVCGWCESPLVWQDGPDGSPSGGWWLHQRRPGDGHETFPVPAEVLAGGGPS